MLKIESIDIYDNKIIQGESQRTEEHVVDVSDLICQENLFFANCIVIGSLRVVGFDLIDGKISINSDVIVDQSDFSEIGYHFSVEFNESNYAGGEALDHGSYGFFCKKTGGTLNWALMSLESNPFIRVEVYTGGVRFLSSSGLTWVVPDDDITKVYIEIGELIFP